MKKITLLLVLCLVLLPSSTDAGEKNLLQPGQRIVILGDSNTYAGQYIVYLEAALRRKYPGKKIELLNVGLPSETASGLSEPDHPFPRPTVHERLDRVLAKTKPDVVVACYGMNDGIYYPFSNERFAAYQKGINTLIAKVKKSGAKIILLTPPPFDPVPLKKSGKLRPAKAKKYAWFAPYAKYNEEVLKRYADWIMQQKNRVDMVIDIYTPIEKHLSEHRKKNPNYALAGDGVHPNKEGHKIIAAAILKASGLAMPKQWDDVRIKLIARRQFLLRNAWLTYTGHKRPGVRKGMPLEQAQQQADALEKQIRALKPARK